MHFSYFFIYLLLDVIFKLSIKYKLHKIDLIIFKFFKIDDLFNYLF